MIKTILYGAKGHMGIETAKLLSASADFETVAQIDKMADSDDCLKNIADYKGEADVIIDFSFHGAVKEIIDYAVKNNVPAVICTTGHTPEELEIINEAAKKIAVFHSANMSLGVALLCNLAKKTAEAFPDADIEIVETHHNRKLDAPSGTALMLGRAIQAVRKNAKLVCGRNGNCKREKEDIGINAVRRGNIVGIHEVYVSTENQTITLKHEAHSRALFADGALSAAKFIAGKGAGLYDMYSIIE